MFNQSSLCALAGAAVVLAGTTASAQIDRLQAAQILIDPVSGVPIPEDSVVWSPFQDFVGFGPGFEGMIPGEFMIQPAVRSGEAFAGPPQILPPFQTSYLFWIDDAPDSGFSHPTRIVLMDAFHPFPTVDNGGIQVVPSAWWPVLVPDPFFPDANIPLFETIDDRTSALPPSPFNPDGLILGPAPQPILLPPLPPVLIGPVMPESKGLIIQGDSGSNFDRDVERVTNGMKARGIDENDIEVQGDNETFTVKDFCDWIDDQINADPRPGCLSIHFVGHGGCLGDEDGDGEDDGGFLEFDPDTGTTDPDAREQSKRLTAEDFCMKMQSLDDAGIKTNVVIEACYSGKMLAGSQGDDPAWKLPNGSSVITSTNDSETALTATGFTIEGVDEDGDGNDDVQSGAYFTTVLERCRLETNDDGDKAADKNGDGVVDDCEALEWVQEQDPIIDFQGKKRYPGGEQPAGEPDGIVTHPQKVMFKDDCPADQNGDGEVTPTDFGAWLNNFNNGDPKADVNGDGEVTPTDFGAWLNAFNQGCE